MRYLIRHVRLLSISAMSLLTLGCTGVKTTINNQYILNSYSSTHRHKSPSAVSLRVSLPEASAGYQTEQMLYIDNPYQLRVFSKNAWVNPPAEMLQPLLIQSLQKTKAFYAITSSTYNEAADYRLDTLLFNLHQNFLKKPSVLEFSAKVLLTRARDNHVIASKILSYSIPCPSDNPVGGVVAANKATLLFTAQVNTFVLSYIDPKS